MSIYRNYKENFVLSPLCVSIELGIVAEGAWNSTRNEISSVIGNQFTERFTKKKYVDKNCMKLFTIIFHSLPVRPTYATTIHQKYGTFFSETNFNRKLSSIKQINHWINDLTNDSINWSIDPNELSEDTTFVVSATLVMKVSWSHNFKCTKSMFTLINGKIKLVKAISTKKVFKCSGTSIRNMFICEIPLNNPRYTSFIVMPRYSKDIHKIINSTTSSLYQHWLGCLKSLKVRVTIPKFSVYTSENIEKYLINSSFSKVFTKNANLSLIFPANTSLGHITSSTYILVDEDGIISSKQESTNNSNNDCIRAIEPEFEFNVNKPFLFIVHDNATGYVAYCCAVMDPTLSTMKY